MIASSLTSSLSDGWANRWLTWRTPSFRSRPISAPSFALLSCFLFLIAAFLNCSDAWAWRHGGRWRRCCCPRWEKCARRAAQTTRHISAVYTECPPTQVVVRELIDNSSLARLVRGRLVVQNRLLLPIWESKLCGIGRTLSEAASDRRKMHSTIRARQ